VFAGAQSVSSHPTKLIDDPELEAEGKGEKIAGKLQKKIGQVEKVAEK
jgi:uncharacterized protein YjbJ (UPF0337 family)